LLQAFLSDGQKGWWDELFCWLGVESSAEMKKRLKCATYSLCYGATKETIRLGKQEGEGLGEHTERFLSHPLVAELWRARNACLRRISADKGMVNDYGDWIAVELRSVSKRSVLAQVGQSYEQALIVEVFKLAKTTDEFTITLYQSDGVSLRFKDSRRKVLWHDRIDSAVNDKAQALGMHTKLAWAW
jgi:hypothetical protein